ncbi:hypothetical protein ACJRO7_002221 [Eucalyptus globulus]|uniref:Serine carboxypeptidase n=1 Tax=Eucalyptus globulus TaxID=34317 RepID=A0ABD3M3J3_EUCGL
MHPQLVPWLIAATLSVKLTRMCSSSTLNTISDADKIISLPGHPKVSFGQYAGYIAMDEKQQRALVYYFVEVKAELASKGPFVYPSGDVLLKSDYSRNKEANMLHLESPARVGFFYSVNTSCYNYVDDKVTAKDNLAFLHNWFKKFPEYEESDLFITGGSYAGHYVPQLAMLIVQSKLFNLKGIAIGNPLLKFNTDFNSRAQSSTITPVCSCVASEASREISRYIDTYDVTVDIDVCIEDETVKYLNRKEVQEVLHARLVGISSVLRYEMHILEISIVSILGELVKSGIHILDSAVPLLGTWTLVNNLAKQLGLNATYGKLAFATIRGASHTAPATQPERSLQLFTSFLRGKSLATNA